MNDTTKLPPGRSQAGTFERRTEDLVLMRVERDSPPFDVYLCGRIVRDDEGYFRFAPEDGVVMTCRQLVTAALKISVLNGMHVEGKA